MPVVGLWFAIVVVPDHTNFFTSSLDVVSVKSTWSAPSTVSVVTTRDGWHLVEGHLASLYPSDLV